MEFGLKWVFRIPMTASNISILIAFVAALVVAVLRSTARGEGKFTQFFHAGGNLRWVHLCLAVIGADALLFVYLRVAGGPAQSDVLLFSIEAATILFLLGASGWLAGLYRRQATGTAPSLVGFFAGRMSRNVVAVSSVITSLVLHLGLILIFGRMLLVQTGTSDPTMLLAAAVVFAGVSAIVGGLGLIVHLQEFCSIVFLLCALLVLNQGGSFLAEAEGMGMSLFGIAPTAGEQVSAVSRFGYVLLIPCMLFWYWGANQYTVQYLVGAGSVQEASKGMRAAAAVKTILLGVLVVACILGLSTTRTANAGLEGMRHEVATVLVFSALVASLSGVFSSVATVSSLDLLDVLRKNASRRQTVLFGRLVASGAAVVALVWVPVAHIVDANSCELLATALVLYVVPVSTVYLFGCLGMRMVDSLACLALCLSWGVGVAALTLKVLVGQSLVALPPFAGSWHATEIALAELFLTAGIILGSRMLVTKPHTELHPHKGQEPS